MNVYLLVGSWIHFFFSGMGFWTAALSSWNENRLSRHGKINDTTCNFIIQIGRSCDFRGIKKSLFQFDIIIKKYILQLDELNKNATDTWKVWKEIDELGKFYFCIVYLCFKNSRRKFNSRIVYIYILFISFHSKPFFLKIKVMKVKKREENTILYSIRVECLFVCLYL